MVHKLLRINKLLGGESRVEVILLSRNSADTGLRVFNSIEHHTIWISVGRHFVEVESPYRYIQAFGSHLFLSTHADDVRNALENGVAAATLVSSKGGTSDDEIFEIRF